MRKSVMGSIGRRMTACSCRNMISFFTSARSFSWHEKRPLNVLFFGSDQFSIHSLRKLCELRIEPDPVVKQLQVVTRSTKNCGRDLSVTREPPIVPACEELGLKPALRCESADDMLGFVRDVAIAGGFNMIIAVSFGKLIPAGLLENLPYSLNVHPSLLPRYRGSSPIQQTLLNRDPETGVSVQTLHPSRFDQGALVAQSKPLSTETLVAKGKTSTFDTPVPPKVAALMDQLGVVGAELLSDVLREGLYRQTTDILSRPQYAESYARRIKTTDKRINWATDHVDTVMAKRDALGALYAFVSARGKHLLPEQKRVIFHSLDRYRGECDLPNLSGAFDYDPALECLVIRLGDGTKFSCDLIQLQGFKPEPAAQFMKSLRKRCRRQTSDVAVFS
ncbi:LAMI_0D06634g1_1 [Lachancea mirantina]|uniref:methionyl-tRNA formyltransferase n=1 Tax=Lachancea mirantina TaxID=1230905 RepID=A0A1G4JCG9_9SACH|nr:LAMI_0D06634g1_1 [Lachancea mirantina]